ncbi:MAG: TOBE domain-containing protein, partial [Halolamina sp.]
DQTEAMTMGDRIAILDDGQLQQVATPLEAYHRPANRFVAGFIGEPSMNFFETTVRGDELVADRFTYPLSPAVAESVADAETVTLGVRPEDVQVHDPGVSGDHDFGTVVDVVEPMGDENNVYLAFDDAEADDADEATFVATVDGMRSVDAGADVSARIPESAIHLFDGETGEALHNRDLDDAVETEPVV